MAKLQVVCRSAREIALDAILGVILLLGAGLGLALYRFPLYVMLSIPPLIRVFMLRPVQRELYYVALVVGPYTDLVFTIGAAGGVFFVRRARGAKRLCHFRRFTSRRRGLVVRAHPYFEQKFCWCVCEQSPSAYRYYHESSRGERNPEYHVLCGRRRAGRRYAGLFTGSQRRPRYSS